MNTNEKGDISETQILARLPWGDKRYDLVIDDNGTFKRVQCKTGEYREKEGVVTFRLQSSYRSKSKQVLTPYSKEEVDIFAVYAPVNDKVYMVPIGDITSKTRMSLRLRERNPSAKGGPRIHWAEDYEI